MDGRDGASVGFRGKGSVYQLGLQDVVLETRLEGVPQFPRARGARDDGARRMRRLESESEELSGEER